MKNNNEVPKWATGLISSIDTLEIAVANRLEERDAAQKEKEQNIKTAQEKSISIRSGMEKEAAAVLGNDISDEVVSSDYENYVRKLVNE